MRSSDKDTVELEPEDTAQRLTLPDPVTGKRAEASAYSSSWLSPAPMRPRSQLTR